MRRIVLWGMATLTTVVLLFGYRTSTQGALGTGGAVVASSPAAPATASGNSGNSGNSGASGSAGGSSGSGSGTGSRSSGTTVTGDVADTQWGPVQVAITVSGGQITAVEVPVYPQNNSRDQELNSSAVPELVQETLAAQSAEIDMISGATITSEGYAQSLQSALDKAGL